MMENITNIIADRQYEAALGSQNATIKPVHPIPKPTEEQYKDFEQSFRTSKTLYEQVISSPIGVYQFKTYCASFSNYTFMVEFLVQYNQLRKLLDGNNYEQVDDESFTELLDLALCLPNLFQKFVSSVKNEFPDSFPANPSSSNPSRNDTFPGRIKKQSFEAGILGYHKSSFDAVRKGQLSDSPYERKLLIFRDLYTAIRKKTDELLDSFVRTEQYKDMISAMWFASRPLTVKDFSLYRDLGRGAFGVVSSAKTKATGTLTAIKCLNKKLVKGKKAKKLVKFEKEILELLGENPSSFTVWLKYAFQDKEYFYLAIPLCTGGDLGYQLRRKGFFNFERASFHAAEVLEGLVHLHNCGIIYRDLKPENVIFDSEGHARISDMGLAYKLPESGEMNGRAGTPGYWAPEVISKRSYGFAADYWSYGVVIYEMLAGICPFSKTNTSMERDQATLEWDIVFPSQVQNPAGTKTASFPDTAKPLLRGLLNRQKRQRWNHIDVRSSKFFKNINWRKLARGEIAPVWRPQPHKIHSPDQVDLDYQNNDSQYRKVKITKEDEIDSFEYVSKYAHEMDVVNVLKVKGRGDLVYEQNLEQPCCCPM
eukprot:maker-scaffold_12-snap-gene-11.18-mRNA-1 protein AED:0.01 eAED:0.01 QI:381/1/1/1/1/1/3/135/593